MELAVSCGWLAASLLSFQSRNDGAVSVGLPIKVARVFCFNRGAFIDLYVLYL